MPITKSDSAITAYCRIPHTTNEVAQQFNMSYDAARMRINWEVSNGYLTKVKTEGKTSWFQTIKENQITNPSVKTPAVTIERIKKENSKKAEEEWEAKKHEYGVLVSRLMETKGYSSTQEVTNQEEEALLKVLQTRLDSINAEYQGMHYPARAGSNLIKEALDRFYDAMAMAVFHSEDPTTNTIDPVLDINGKMVIHQLEKVEQLLQVTLKLTKDLLRSPAIRKLDREAPDEKVSSALRVALGISVEGLPDNQLPTEDRIVEAINKTLAEMTKEGK